MLAQVSAKPTSSFDLAKLRETLELAETMAAENNRHKAAAARGRKNCEGGANRSRKQSSSSAEPQFVPPKQLLMYLVRMGSFTSARQVEGGDSQDEHLEFPPTSLQHLLARCRQELHHLPPPFQRSFRSFPQHTSSTLPHLNKMKNETDESLEFRDFQWNHLSQTLGTKNDKFVSCPPEALSWETRRWRLLEEILRYQPDLICLQEVDHFRLFSRALASVGYTGRFVPKPDSPCIYLEENNGPDGCAIFVRNDQFEILSEAKRILEVWKVASNQVVLLLNLRHRQTGREVAVATTHLKARNGALLSTLRNEQGKDLLAFLGEAAGGRPLVLAGDFNADPAEPVYQTLTNSSSLGLRSAYDALPEPGQSDRLATPTSSEEYYTTWKIRETGEQKQVLDYIFHSEPLRVSSVLEMPTEAQIGVDRLPSLQFASDHLSLVADFVLTP